MPRYAAFLRGVSPMNAKMPDLARSFVDAGFEDVRTVLSSGNVVFTARKASEAALQVRAEKAMQRQLGHAFLTIVRPVDALRAMLERDPFAAYRLAAGHKRVVTFLREPARAKVAVPIELDGARILRVDGAVALSAYLPGPRGPVFMTLIEKTFGAAVTTRTWETVGKVVRAGGA